MLNTFSVNTEYSSRSCGNLAQLTQIPVLAWAYEHTRRHFVLDITHLHCVCDDNYCLIYVNTYKLCILCDTPNVTYAMQECMGKIEFMAKMSTPHLFFDNSNTGHTDDV